MDGNETKSRNGILVQLIGILVSFADAAVGLIFGTRDSILGLIILVSIFIFIVLFFLISWPVSRISKKFKVIDTNLKRISILEKDLNSLKERIDLIKELSNLKSRMAAYEKKRKKT